MGQEQGQEQKGEEEQDPGDPRGGREGEAGEEGTEDKKGPPPAPAPHYLGQTWSPENTRPPW